MKVEDKIDESVDEYYPLVSDIFKDKDNLKDIWLRFSQFEDYRITIPLRVCQIIACMKQLDPKKIGADAFRLILATSIIELLNTEVEYQDFATWLSQNRKKVENKSCLQAWNIYNRVHGCSGKFRKFFKLLTKKEKTEVVPTVQTRHGNRFAPLCHQDDDSCFWRDSAFCNYHFYESQCPMLKNDRILNKALKEFGNFLYTMRSQFVHSGRIPILARPLPKDIAGMSSVYDYYEMRDYKGPVLINLRSDALYALLVKYLPEMFESYLKAQK